MTAIIQQPMSSDTLQTPQYWGGLPASEAWGKPLGWEPTDHPLHSTRHFGRPPGKDNPYADLLDVVPIHTTLPPPQQPSTQNEPYKQADLFLDPARRHVSPPDDVSPKHHQQIKVEFKQEPDMYQEDSTDQIASYLQIPPEISSSKGSLPDFAAKVTCLFWFESPQTLLKIEKARSTPFAIQPLCKEADPTMGFRKWVTTMLSTTQVSTNVVLMALMFVYRLKTMNTTVRGKQGSEYRLLTVALMLGNKFLDDNTYTNKTWAEVSGITVNEIHVMEVEFLSNMRYNLYASKDTWNEWVRKLRSFAEYFDAASRVAEAAAVQAQTEPWTQVFGPPYQSTPVGYSQPSTPSRPHANTALVGTPTARLPHPLARPVHPNQILAGPPSRIPDVLSQTAARKRSYDEAVDERPSKRISRHYGLESAPDTRSPTAHLSAGNGYAEGTRSLYPEIANRPARNDISPPLRGLPPLPLSATVAPTMLPQLPVNYPQLSQVHPGRAMASVYPSINPSGPDALKPQPQMPQLGLRIPPLMDPNQPLSAVASRNNSPMASVMTPTNELLSPMVYGNFRSSPYKPVRSVNHLLAPPPSASLGLPANAIGSSDLQYRPLMKQPGQSRTGVVPHIHPSSSQQSNWHMQHPHGYQNFP